MVSWGPYNTW